MHNAGYFPFGLQNDNTAVTPNGEIYFTQRIFVKIIQESAGFQHWFIHEMAHVWQYQMKMNVLLRGTMSWAATYEYSLPNYNTLADYGMEQQASILADYFYLFVLVEKSGVVTNGWLAWKGQILKLAMKPCYGCSSKSRVTLRQ